jgi:hypothetical protein
MPVHPATPTPDPLVVSPGETVQVRFGKWGGGPHWAFDLVYLGADEFGRWAGGPAGLPMARPGWSTTADTDGVLCFSHRNGFVATVNADAGDPGAVEVYVDISTPPVWHRDPDTGFVQVRMVDLDLDVVRRFDGTLFVDDEDEFADHQVSLGYPAAVVAAAQRECGTVFDAVRRDVGPYGEVARGWLASYRSGPHHTVLG